MQAQEETLYFNPFWYEVANNAMFENILAHK